jgi:integrase
MPLTEAQIAKLKPGPKEQKLLVEPGLYVVVRPTGSKSWRAFPLVNGKRRTVVLGALPQVTLQEARNRFIAMKRAIEEGLDPVLMLRLQRQRRIIENSVTLGRVFWPWFNSWKPRRSQSWAANVERWWRQWIEPQLGSVPVTRITTADVVAAMQRVHDKTESLGMAHDVRRLLWQLLNNSKAGGLIASNPADGTEYALPPPEKGSIPLLTIEQARALVAKLPDTGLFPQTECAVLALLVSGLRVSELLSIRVEHVQADRVVIPRANMKVSRGRPDFILPLSTHLRAIFSEALKHADGGWLFPGTAARDAPLHRSAINQVFKRAGAGSPHGARKMLSTFGYENGHDALAIELCLDHVPPGSSVSVVYNRAEVVEKRRLLLQALGDAVLGPQAA